MARKTITAIDAGSSAIRVIVAEKMQNGSLHILGANQRQSEGIRRGYITNLEDATSVIESAIKGAEKIAGIPIKKAVTGIGGISLSSIRAKGMIIISKADGEITEYDIKRVVSQSEDNLQNFSNKSILSTIPLSYKIDNSPIPGRPIGMKGAKLEAEVLFITCLTQHLNDLIKAIEMAGVSVDDIMPSPLAMANTALTKYQKEVGCVLANIGANTVSIAVFEEGLPVSLEVFPIGSTHITNDIALGLQIPLEEAERVKIDYGSEKTPQSKKKLPDIIEARLTDIFDLIEAHLKKINRNKMLPAGIILTGGGSALFNMEDIAKTSLNLPSKIGTFALRGINHIKITAASNSLKDLIINDPAWSVALGLCIKDSTGKFSPESETTSSNISSKIRQLAKKGISLILP